MYGTIPLLRKERLYGFLDLLFVSGSYAIASWCYVQGATLAGMLSFWQAVASTFGAVLAFGFMVVLIGVISTRYGFDHWVYQRAVFGYVGVLILAIIAIASTWGFYAINAQLFAQSMQKVGNSLGADIGDGWLKPFALACVVIGWALAMKGPMGVKWATRIMAPCLLAVGLFVTVAVIIKGHSTLFSAGPIGSEPNTSGDLGSYALATEWNVAFVLSWYPVIGAITRLVKKERQAYWGLYLGYGFLMAWFILIAAATALVMAPELGFASADPTDYLLELGGPWMGTLSLVAIGMANITTMTVGTYGLTISTKILAPSWNYRIVGTLWAIWCAILTVWGGVWTYYPKFLAVVGIVAGPAMALLLVDYFVVRRQRISPTSMFDLKNGKYKYSRGFNIPAFIAFGAGATSYLLLYDPFNYVVRSSLFNYVTATGFAAIVAAVVYVLEAQIPAVKRYLTRDVNEEAAATAPSGVVGESSEA